MASQPDAEWHGPFWDRNLRQHYWYEARSDALIWENGERRPRPDATPRSQYQTRGERPNHFQYTGSPPGANASYVTIPNSVQTGADGRTRSDSVMQQLPSTNQPTPTRSRQISTQNVQLPRAQPQSAPATQDLSFPNQALADLSLRGMGSPAPQAPPASSHPPQYRPHQPFGSSQTLQPSAPSVQQSQGGAAHYTIPNAQKPRSSQPNNHQVNASSSSQEISRPKGKERAHDLQGSTEQETAHPSFAVQERILGDAERQVVQRFDPISLVWTRFQTSPAEEITDPELYRGGVRAVRRLLPAPDLDQADNTEKLFATFQVRPHPRKFFTVGKVFMILWVEPAGEQKSKVTTIERGTTEGRYGEKVHSKVRRFVVVREGANYCSALPIATYGKQACGKLGVTKSEHAIIHTGKNAPQPIEAETPARGEQGMRPEPIRVNADDPKQKLDPLSRLDLGKVHTIQHNVKVRSFGKVHPRSMSALLHQFGNIFTQTPLSSRTNTTATTSVAARQVHNMASSSDRAQAFPEVRAGLAPIRENRPLTQVSEPGRSDQSAGSHQGSQRLVRRAQSRPVDTREESADDDEHDQLRDDGTDSGTEEESNSDESEDNNSNDSDSGTEHGADTVPSAQQQHGPYETAVERLRRQGMSRDQAEAVIRAQLSWQRESSSKRQPGQNQGRRQ